MTCDGDGQTTNRELARRAQQAGRRQNQYRIPLFTKKSARLHDARRCVMIMRVSTTAKLSKDQTVNRTTGKRRGRRAAFRCGDPFSR